MKADIKNVLDKVIKNKLHDCGNFDEAIRYGAGWVKGRIKHDKRNKAAYIQAAVEVMRGYAPHLQARMVQCLAS